MHKTITYYLKCDGIVSSKPNSCYCGNKDLQVKAIKFGFMNRLIEHYHKELKERLKARGKTKFSIVAIQEYLRTHKTYLSDSTFEFNFGIFQATQKNSLYILIHLNQIMTGIQHMTMTAQKDNLQIEHIMLQTIKDTPWNTYFEKELELKNPTARNDYHKNNLNRLRNLTLLNPSSNSVARNLPFNEKKRNLQS